MTITPQELLDTSIAQLRTLAAFLDEQLGDGGDTGGYGTAEAGACREMLRSLRVLIPKLEAVRPCGSSSEGYRVGRSM